MSVVHNPNTSVPYLLGQLRGEGSFGEVFDCMDNAGQSLAIKLFKGAGWAVSEWSKEVNNMGAVLHENIIRLVDAFKSSGYYFLVMERAHGSIRDFVANYGAQPSYSTALYGMQLLSALDYIHSRSLIHRDIHVDNVLYVLDSAGGASLKISDFGISSPLRGGWRYRAGNYERPCPSARRGARLTPRRPDRDDATPYRILSTPRPFRRRAARPKAASGWRIEAFLRPDDPAIPGEFPFLIL
jgi:serine/threonine protein kinase